MHFNWLQYWFGFSHEMTHVYTAALVAGLLLVVGIYARVRLGTGEEAIIPAGRFSVRGFFEVVTEYWYDLSKQIIGDDGPLYVPLAAAIFIFIFFNNMIGLIPGMTSPSSNLNTSFSIGVFSFVYYNYIGLRHGGLHYFQQFLGPIWWLMPLILPIEILSHAFRPLTLGLRLEANMLADHTVLGVFHQLVPIGIPIPFYAMGVVISLLQAFVFALLTLVYVMLAKSHH